MQKFELDEQLKSDCLTVAKLDLCQILLMNDCRWPWLILVPQIVDATEIHILGEQQQMTLQRECVKVAEILANVTQCGKINTGALGNIVRQLHVHIIGRNAGDENWPGPVWGFGKRVSYQARQSNTLISAINNELKFT